MKYTLHLFIFLALTHMVNAQVGIGTAAPAEGTLLHVDDGIGDKGILIPRVQIDDLSTTAPLTGTLEVGTMVFNSTGANDIGFYYWDGSKWVKISDAIGSSDDTNLATEDLTQDAETRVYDMNGQDLNFTNGSLGINTADPEATLDAQSTANENAFRFVQSDNLTGEKDVFTIEDQDVGGGGQDKSSVLKVHKSGNINSGDDGFSLIELVSDGADAGDNKYWISGHKVDESNPTWGVDITDSDFWSDGGIQLGVTTNSNGTYSDGTFKVEYNGDTGIGTISPSARLQIDEDSGTFEETIVKINTSSNRSLNILQPDVSDINSPFTFQTNNAFNFRTDSKDALTVKNTGDVGINQNDPQTELHIGGTNATIRIDGLSTSNNANNNVEDVVPLYVNNDGDIVTQPSLVQSFMPINLTNFLGAGGYISSETGAAVTGLLNTSTITLTQRSLVHYSYQFSVNLSREDDSVITDGASRLFRSWFTVNDDDTQPMGYNTGTYTNNPDVDSATGTYASGFYYLSGNGYVELPAGTHTLKLYARGFGGTFDFKMIFGETDYESIQAVIHR